MQFDHRSAYQVVMLVYRVTCRIRLTFELLFGSSLSVMVPHPTSQLSLRWPTRSARFTFRTCDPEAVYKDHLPLYHSVSVTFTRLRWQAQAQNVQ